MAEWIQVESEYVECPHCHVMMRSPAELVAMVMYPDDLDEIDQLLRGELNAVEHGDGHWVSFAEHLVLYDPRLSRVVSTFELAGMFAADELEHLDVTPVGGYPELVDVLYGWLWADTGRTMSPGPEFAALFDLDPAAFLRAVRPLALLVIKAHRDGYLPLNFTIDGGTTAEQANQLVRELGVQLTVRAIRQVVELVVKENRVVEVFDELGQRIPSRCLDDVVLEALSTTAREVLDDHSKHLMVRWRTGVADAAAHAAAGRRSPSADDFLQLLWALWNFGRREDVELDQRIWITPEVMRRLVEPSRLLALLSELWDEATAVEPFLANVSGFAEALGHDDTVAAALSQFQARLPEPADADVDKMVDSLVSVAAERFDRTQVADAWDRGWMLAKALWGVIGGLPQELAVRGYDRARTSIPTAATVEVFAFDCATCQSANRTQRTELARECAARILDLWGDDAIEPARALFGVNEAANTARLLSAYPEALELYRIAAEIDEYVEADNSSTIERNRAIVLRDLGDFVAARDILTKLVQSDPDAFDTIESLATVSVRVGDYTQAVAIADDVLARHDLAPETRRRFTRFKGFCCAFAGDAAGAVENLGDELRREPSGSSLRLTVLSVLMRVDSDDPATRELIEQCAEEISGIAVEAAAVSRSVGLTAAASLAFRRVRQQDRVGAQAAYDLCTAVLGSQTDRPWQVELVRAWLCIGVDDGEAVEAMRSAIVGLESRVPEASQAGFAMTWIGDADIALLQSISTQLAISGATTDLDDLLASFDLQNGRELTSLAARSRPVPDLGEVEARLRAFQSAEGTDVVAVLDSVDSCSLLVVPADGAASVVPLANADQVRSAVLRLSYPFNPVAPEGSDKLLRPWWDFAADFAAVVRDRLPANRPLLILDGSRLVGTPLQAAGWPAAPLIFDRPVSFAVNSRLLLASPPLIAGERRTALVCPKQGDRPEFVGQLEATGDSLRQRGYAVSSGTEVDEQTLAAALGASREVVLLCHGVSSATATEGPGICVAAGGKLPPSALLVDRDPALHAFVVTWRDLISLESTPEVVISLACSSGRTRSGRGGTRIGLDQALVGRSTSQLISPVWNVAQASALEWLQALMRARSTESLRDAYRTAVLAIADRHPHPYHWAPFTLRTHYQGGGHDGS